jgi:hypothetical protein
LEELILSTISSITAMDYVAKESKTSRRPTVVNMSLGGARSGTMDAATTKVSSSLCETL